VSKLPSKLSKLYPFNWYYPPLAILVLLAWALLFFVLLYLPAKITLEKETQKAISEVKAQYENLMFYQGIDLPETFYFCGTRIDVQSYQEQLMLKKALAYFLDKSHLTSLYLSALPHYLPWIEEILQQNGLPDDLKFVPVIESGLDPQIRSSAGAIGWWQFMKYTARFRNLVVTRYVDQRRDPIMATYAASRHFQSLYDKFDGDWPLVLAAYNAGEGRVREAQRIQGHLDYSLLNLPQETRNFVYLIMAIKIIYENPQLYKFQIAPENYFVPLEFDTLTVTVNRGTRLTLSEIARACDTSTQAIQDLNPSFLTNDIPRGEWLIRLPKNKRELFLTNYYEFH